MIRGGPVEGHQQGGGTVSGWVVAYAAQHQPVSLVLYYIDEFLAAVDDDPEGPTPVWIDPGVLTDNAEVRTDRHQTCRWRRLTSHERAS